MVQNLDCLLIAQAVVQCLHGKLIAEQAKFLATVTDEKSGYINKQSQSGVSQAPRLTPKFKNIERTVNDETSNSIYYPTPFKG
ncbi:hypothetical protein [Nostoc sp. DedQUE05]|uniref:hypothetical protein n=1 Tax=Nostoc sp. DedQUE05 TaxID=3075391 RepID=UPI002AD54488|nr:hypothetical protein [Nostoc sp. DedQUE05]